LYFLFVIILYKLAMEMDEANYFTPLTTID